MIIIWNPTNETLVMQFEGRTYTMPPNDRQKVTEPCGKHLLTGYGQRGLTSLEYGDDEIIIGEQAKERNREFKLKQVVDYNQRNEARKQMNLSYINPPAQIKQYARDIGIEIIAPFSVRTEENARIQQLEDINKSLAGALEEERTERNRMSEMMNSIMAKLESAEKTSAVSPDKEAKKGVKLS